LQLTKAMREADMVVMMNVALKQLPQVWLSGTPLFVSHHTAFRYDDRPPSWQARLKHWVANRLAVGQCACSAYVARPYHRCPVVPNPFRMAMDARPHEDRVPFSILFAGRLVPDKGVDLLLAAMPMVLKALPQARLSIVGDGPERERLQQSLPSLQIGHAVQFWGEQSPAVVQQLMSTHSLLVVPSRMEPFGIVVLEGMAAGCRLLLAPQGGLPEAGNRFADYISPANRESLANAMIKALQLPPVGASERAERQAFLEKHSPQASALALETCLQRSLAAGK
jgi:glycosyltransferase involved in cell wall biosynthesis